MRVGLPALSSITAILDRKILHLNTELFCLVSQ